MFALTMKNRPIWFIIASTSVDSPPQQYHTDNMNYLLQYVNRNTCFRLMIEKFEKERNKKTFLRAQEIFPNGKKSQFLCDVFVLIKSADKSYCSLLENATNLKNAVKEQTAILLKVSIDSCTHCCSPKNLTPPFGVPNQANKRFSPK